MNRKKDTPSNYSVYFLKGFDAAKSGQTIAVIPPEIKAGDSYSQYLQNAFILGFDIGKVPMREIAETPEA